jgi:DtxR family Mn-dependent transcriptional regulator
LRGTLTSTTPELVTITTAAGAEIAVTFSVAETVSVLADPSPPSRIALPAQLVLARERYGR